MSKALIIITFANYLEHPLFNLKSEKVKVTKIVNECSSYQYFDSKIISTRAEIIELLKDDANQKNLQFFSYSGHADGDTLITEDDDTAVIGIAKLLSNCQNLKLIILNGCSTEGQVRKIFDAFLLKGFTPPALIATDSSVNDALAMEFGIHLFEQIFTVNSTIYNAFEFAIGVVKTKKEASQILIDENAVRALKRGSKRGNWGLYVPENKDKKEFTSITFNDIVSNYKSEPFEANRYLFSNLIYSLKKYNLSIEKIYEDKEEDISELAVYKQDIFTCFPYPIARRLQKLISAENKDEENKLVFYNLKNKLRIEELLRTYQTIIFTLYSLAQSEVFTFLYELNKSEAKGAIMEKEIKEQLISFQIKKDSIVDRLTVESLKVWLNSLNMIKTNLFLKEMGDLHQNEDFFNAILFLEKISKLNLNDYEAKGLVEPVEIQLTEIFNHISFFANYKFISIDNIFLNKRRKESPEYKHEFFYQEIGGQKPAREKVSEKIYNSLDNSSVIVINKQDSLFLSYLNLYPFIIDEVLFEEKANESNLMFLGDINHYDGEFTYYKLDFTKNFISEKKELLNIKNPNGLRKLNINNAVHRDIKKEWKLYYSLMKGGESS